MGLFDEIKSPFRWYDSRTKRHAEKRVCVGVCPYKLITPVNKLLPFQLFREAVDPIAYTWVVKDEDGNVVYSPDTSLLQLFYFADWNYIVYNGDEIPGMVLPCGYYTSEITDGTTTWYSELFYVTQTVFGNNVVNNHNFHNDLDDWTSSGFTVTGTTEKTACTPGGGGELSQENILEPNTVYEVTIKLLSSGPPGTVKVYLGDEELDFTEDGESKVCATSSGSNTDVVVNADAFEGCIYYVIVRPVIDPIMIEWSNCSTVGNMYYGTSGYKNRFYFDPLAEVVQNQPQIIKDGIEDSNKDFVLTWGKRLTTYSIYAGMLPGYVIDALYEMIIHDTITMYLPSNKGSGLIKNVEINPSWSAEGVLCMAETIMIFEVTSTIETGCCSEDTLFTTCTETVVVDVNGVDPAAVWFCIGFNGVIDAYSFITAITLLNVSDLEAELNSLGIGVFTCTYDSVGETVTVTVEQLNPVAYVFNYLTFDLSGTKTFTAFEDNDCGITPTECTFSITVDVGVYDPASTWSFIGYEENIDNPTPADYPIPGAINIHDIASLETYLNTLGIGTWVVTNPSADDILIVNTQSSPPLYNILDICVDTPETVCFEFENNCD